MVNRFSFWSGLFAVLGALVAMCFRLVGIVNSGDPNDPDDWTPIPPMTARAVESYAFAGCTDQEIADRFLVDVDFLRREFTPLLRATRGLRAYRLRGAQSKLAFDGNSPTLIWLGKNDLGQSNSPSPSGPAEPELQ